ncbi:MAG: S41 family peptidase, partial [Ginsengibacter sp.]
MKQNKKLQVWLPLLFAIVLILGMYFGNKLHDEMGGQNSFFKTTKRSSIQEAMDLIRLKYVDSVHLDTLQDNAIQQMMSELDPHSVYIPASKLQEVNEDLNGAFEG